MANRNQFKLSVEQRQNRHFSESFRRQKVQELEIGLIRICDIEKEYQVSATSIYRWISKFGGMSKKKEKLIVESDSDTKKLLDLQKKVAELERKLGQKQIELEFKDKMIDIAEQMYRVDIKKKFGSQPSDTSGSTGKE